MTVAAPPAWESMPALMYHSVSAVGGPLSDLAVPRSRLAEQLGALVAAGYTLVGMSEALDRLERGPAGKLLAVTFDDGYRDFLAAALPALEGLGARATLYVPSRALGGTASWLPGSGADLPLLTAAEVGEVAARGVEIGSHGAVHVPMDVLPPGQALRQLLESREVLQDVTGGPVTSFCYPHGYHSRRLRGAVRSAGYDNACAIGHRLHGAREDRLAVSRLLAGPQHSPEALVRLVRSGHGGPAPALKRAVTRPWRVARRVVLRTAGVTWT